MPATAGSATLAADRRPWPVAIGRAPGQSYIRPHLASATSTMPTVIENRTANGKSLPAGSRARSTAAPTSSLWSSTRPVSAEAGGRRSRRDLGQPAVAQRPYRGTAARTARHVPPGRPSLAPPLALPGRGPLTGGCPYPPVAQSMLCPHWAAAQALPGAGRTAYRPCPRGLNGGSALRSGCR